MISKQRKQRPATTRSVRATEPRARLRSHTQEKSGATANRFFHLLAESGEDMMYRTQLHPFHKVEFMSGATERITGRSPVEFYADPTLVARAVHPDDTRLVLSPVDTPEQLQTKVVLRWVHHDGTVVWAEHRRVPVYDSSGRVVAIEGIARDITEHVVTQQRLKESEEQLRQLAARVQAAREEERTALARELHDELGQTLTAAKLELQRASEAMTREQVSLYSVDRLQSLMGLVDIGIESVKRLSAELRPPALDHLGLGAAIRWEAVAFRARTRIRCRVQASDDPTRLTDEQQIVLFRIFQEALTNVARHARASAVSVKLAERARSFELRIRDNGRGIPDAAARSPRSIGLAGMRERAMLVGGTFDISGRRGKGTAILVRVPLALAPKQL